MRELLPNTPRGTPLQNLDEIRHRNPGWQLDAQMHMIGHRLDLDHHPSDSATTSPMICFNRVAIGPRNTSRPNFRHQITWYFTENTDLPIDRYCINLTINPTYDKHRPLRRPKDGIGYPPAKVESLRRRKFQSSPYLRHCCIRA